MGLNLVCFPIAFQSYQKSNMLHIILDNLCGFECGSFGFYTSCIPCRFRSVSPEINMDILRAYSIFLIVLYIVRRINDFCIKISTFHLW